jgi:hypothetical protein
MTKACIALYTCASTRAVHLELVPNLTADAFIRSFRRFISRRGIPKFILSDNAKHLSTQAINCQHYSIYRKSKNCYSPDELNGNS